MGETAEAVQAALGALQRVSATVTGERGRRASVVALVLRSVAEAVAEGDSREFLARRAGAEVERLPGGPEQSMLRRLLGAGIDVGPIAEVLSDYAAGLEESRRLEEASAVIDLAVELAPSCAEIALRAGRIARLEGDRERALARYRRAAELDVAGGCLARLAAVGEAAIAEDPGRALTVAKRAAVRAGDSEAAAVALEERSRVRRTSGDRNGATRDLAVAAACFSDPIDRARLAHRLADMYSAAGDPLAARESLVVALAIGDPSQRGHARARLHGIARDLGDQVGMRRWRSFTPPPMVSLSGRVSKVGEESAAGRVARWRERLTAE